jgi:hypothetical protein
MGGYRFVFDHLENQTSRSFVAQLDRQEYDESHLIEIKVPIDIPYQQSWSEYERYDGEIVVDGVHYNYVKRKLDNGYMSFLCLPNTDKMRVYNARETFFSLVNDIQQEKENQQSPIPNTKALKFNIGEYEASTLNVLNINVEGRETSNYSLCQPSLLEGHGKSVDQPPTMA